MPSVSHHQDLPLLFLLSWHETATTGLPLLLFLVPLITADADTTIIITDFLPSVFASFYSWLLLLLLPFFRRCCLITTPPPSPPLPFLGAYMHDTRLTIRTNNNRFFLAF